MIAKIFQNQFTTSPIGIIDDINEFNIELKINEGSKGLISTESLEFDFKPFNRIELYEVKDNTDILIFTGYIIPTLDLNGYQIEIRDENDLMNKKLVLSDKSYTNKTPLFILQDITSDWLSETGEDWQVISSVSDTLTTDFKKGDTFYSVLNELSQELGYNWLVKGQTIYFDEVVGIDKSSGPLFEELVYNGFDHTEDTINNIKLEYLGNIANLIIGSNSTSKVLKKELDTRGAIGEFRSFNNGDLNTQAQAYLDLKKQELFNYSFEITLDKTDIDLGDKVYCRVENTEKGLLDYEGTIIVNSVKLDYKNATIFKTLTVNNSVIKRNLLTTRLENLERNINLLLKK